MTGVESAGYSAMVRAIYVPSTCEESFLTVLGAILGVFMLQPTHLYSSAIILNVTPIVRQAQLLRVAAVFALAAPSSHDLHPFLISSGRNKCRAPRRQYAALHHRHILPRRRGHVMNAAH